MIDRYRYRDRETAGGGGGKRERGGNGEREGGGRESWMRFNTRIARRKWASIQQQQRKTTIKKREPRNHFYLSKSKAPNGR